MIEITPEYYFEWGCIPNQEMMLSGWEVIDYSFLGIINFIIYHKKLI